jgi:hypothetical protein
MDDSQGNLVLIMFTPARDFLLETPLIHPIFLWLIGGDYRKVPSMFGSAAHPRWPTRAAILDFVSVYFLTNACIDWSDFLVAHWE